MKLATNADQGNAGIVFSFSFDLPKEISHGGEIFRYSAESIAAYDEPPDFKALFDSADGKLAARCREIRNVAPKIG